VTLVIAAAKKRWAAVRAAEQADKPAVAKRAIGNKTLSTIR